MINSSITNTASSDFESSPPFNSSLALFWHYFACIGKLWVGNTGHVGLSVGAFGSLLQLNSIVVNSPFFFTDGAKLLVFYHILMIIDIDCFDSGTGDTWQ